MILCTFIIKEYLPFKTELNTFRFNMLFLTEITNQLTEDKVFLIVFLQVKRTFFNDF